MCDSLLSKSADTKRIYSSKIKERRRSLFPSDGFDSTNFDLGHMSPLNCNDISDCTLRRNEDILSSTTENSLVDFETQSIMITPSHQKHSYSEHSMSPLYLSPLPSVTPLKISPTKTLKTPNDSINPSKLPKLSRKSYHDSFLSEFGISNYKSNSPVKSPAHKFQKFQVHFKSSKVRTSLFSDMSVSTKSFYPKTDESHAIGRENSVKPVKSTNVRRNQIVKPKKKLSSKSRLGQINAGVKHAIKKVKHKKVVTKSLLLKASEDIINNSPLTNYLKDLDELNVANKIRQIEHKPSDDAKTNVGGSELAMSEYLNDLEELQNPSNNIKQIEIISPSRKILSEVNRKRAHSPMPDQIAPKKIFRSCGEEKENTIGGTEIAFDNDEQDIVIPDYNMTAILCCLEEHEEIANTPLPLEAHKSILASDEKILHKVPEQPSPMQPITTAEMFLSPTSQMCNMASGLALNTPTKAKNLNPILNNMKCSLGHSNVENSNVSINNEALYPIFCNRRISENVIPAEIVKSSNRLRKIRKVSKDQMLLDAGQKRFGLTECNECKVIYHIGDPSDEAMHQNYHNSTQILKFLGWKNERVVRTFDKDRIIVVLPRDSKLWIKKMKELIPVINRDLGYFDIDFNITSSQIFLYIKSKTIAGCLIAELKKNGHKMLTSPIDQVGGVDLCSEEHYPIKCGVSRIWVPQMFRKKGVATMLMDALRHHFSPGTILTNEDIAFSSPTQAGKKFASKYFNTPNFLTYF